MRILKSTNSVGILLNPRKQGVFKPFFSVLLLTIPVSTLCLLSVGAVSAAGISTDSGQPILKIHQVDSSGRILVTIDPDIMAASQIERRDSTSGKQTPDQRMIIRLPENASVESLENPRLTIDPALKTSDLVSMERLPNGKKGIVIHSLNVLFDIHKLPPLHRNVPLTSHFQTASSDMPPGKKSSEAPTNAIKSQHHPSDRSSDSDFVDLSPPSTASAHSADSDPENWSEGTQGIPLAKIIKSHSQPIQGGGMIPRILFGLAFVILLAYATLRYALPWLMRKHPNLFAGKQPASTLPPDEAASISHTETDLLSESDYFEQGIAPPPELTSEETLTPTPPQKIVVTTAPTRMRRVLSFLRILPVNPETPPAEEPQEEAPKVEEKPITLNILTSASLGADKELHLIDVGGRKLVIATLPDQIMLLTEFGDDNEATTHELLNQMAPEAQQNQVKAYLPESNASEPGAASQNTVKPEQRNETPILKNEYYTPKPASTGTIPSYEELVMADFENVYKKYITDDMLESDGTDLPYANVQTGNSGGKHYGSRPVRHSSRIVEAEEVIRLRDYEDEY